MTGVIINTAVLLAMIAAFVCALVALFRERKGPLMVCTQCGHHGQTRRETRGSTGIELVLWLCFLLPGLIYSIWRLSTRRAVCASCGSPAVVPPLSPVGQRMIAAGRDDVTQAPRSSSAIRT